ncbi:MAG TPA: hypothetical protein VGJ13_04935 [Pseudonocardiaceae bacterium]
MTVDCFYLGVHQPGWLAVSDVPLFVSHRRLASYRTLPRARADWALDSGGFSELTLHGEWRTTPEEYATAVRRYDLQVGRLCWAAPQDWMCEPVMLARTGLSVTEHQHRTVENYLRLQEIWSGDTDDEPPFVPVLQGWTIDDYLRCWDLYTTAGVDLRNVFLVGLGSVCRRQATSEIGRIVTTFRSIDPGLPLHGFGCKTLGLRRYGHHLSSADSMAWSFEARRMQRLSGAPGCSSTHKNCANCLPYALHWRSQMIDGFENNTTVQGDLFESMAGVA